MFVTDVAHVYAGFALENENYVSRVLSVTSMQILMFMMTRTSLPSLGYQL